MSKLRPTSTKDPVVQLIDDVLNYLMVPIYKANDNKTMLGIEQLLIAGLNKISNGKAKDALEAAQKALFTSTGQVTSDTVKEAAEAVSAAIGAPLKGDQVNAVEKTLKAAYALGKDRTCKSLEVESSTNLKDKKTIKWCQDDTTYWIGRHYSDKLGGEIAQRVTEEALKWGMGRAEVGKKLKDLLGGQFQKSDAYWQGLAGTVLSRARNFGAIGAMEDAQVATYEIIAMMDERTSDICRFMNGRIFSVKDAAALRDKMISSKTPDAVRQVHPWLPFKQLKTLGPDALIASGQALPPYHFFCRTTVVVRDFEDTAKPLGPLPLRIEVAPATDDMPKDLSSLTYAGDARSMGGAGKKSFYEDAQGTRYLFKPGLSKSGTPEGFRAHVQEAASKLGDILFGDDHVSVVTVKGPDGKLGTLQRIIPDIVKNLKGEDLATLTKAQRARIQQEHVLDWLMGNFDSQGGNFVIDKAGKVWAVDKEQGFRYIGDGGSSRMDLDYHPNAQHHEDPPIYNKLFGDFALHGAPLQLQDTLPILQRVESISDADYKKILTPYAEALHGKGTSQSAAFLHKAVLRKNNLRDEYESFFSMLQTGKNGKITPFAFLDKIPAVGQTAIPANMKLNYEVAKKISVSDLKKLAKAQGIPSYQLLKKDELAQALSDPTKIQGLVSAAKQRLTTRKKVNVASLATIPGQDVLFSDAMSQLKPKIINTSIPSDAGMLEGQELRAMQFTEDGVLKTRIIMKVTEDFHAKVEAALKGAPGSLVAKLEWKENISGNAKEYVTGANASSSNKRTACREAVVHGVKIQWVNTQSSMKALHGQLLLTADSGAGSAAARDIEGALKQLQISELIAPRTDSDKEILKMSRVLWQLDPPKSQSLTSADRTESKLKSILSTYGVTDTELKSVVWKEVAPGHSTYVWEKRSDFYKKLGGKFIFHGLGDADEKLAASLFLPDSPGVLCTVGRHNVGILGSGKSPGADLDSGGASSVFCRLVTKKAVKDGGRYNEAFAGGKYRLIFGLEELDRTDWYAYGYDNFGSTSSSDLASRPTAESFVKRQNTTYNRGNEIMFRDALSAKNIKCITCDTQGEKDALVKAFKNNGMSSVNGLPVDKFVVVSDTFQRRPWP